jgi:adenylate cyclase
LCDYRAMRVRRSFCFVDLSGFTAMTEASGDEQAVAVLTGFRAAVRDICSRRAVRIAKWLGDGAMLVSVETAPIVSTALELLFKCGAKQVAVRCGITTGSVILLEGDDYIGHCVNIAARLCDLAHAGEVLASPDLVPHMPPWSVLIERKELEVSGLGHPVAVVRLALRSSDLSVTDPICGIPLCRDSAFEIRTDGSGAPVLLCSASCLETWVGRERINAEG